MTKDARASLVKVTGGFFLKTGDGRTAPGLLLSGHYHYVVGMARRFVESPSFRISQEAGKVELALVEFRYNPSDADVLTEIAERGLERPTEEDVLRFGLKYSGEYKRRRVIFHHEPWAGEDGNKYILTLSSAEGNRELGCARFPFKRNLHAVFAARCPR